MRVIRQLVAVLAVGALLLAAGCGSGGGDPFKGKSAEDIVNQSKATLSKASGVHLSGTLQDEDGNTVIDLVISGDGAVTGTLKNGDGVLEIIKVKDAVYLKGNAAAWQDQTGDEAAQTMAGKWIKMPTQAGAGGFFGIASLGDLADEFSPSNPARLPGTKKVNGKTVVGLEGKDSTGEDIIMYVENTKDARPVQIAPGKGSSATGDIDFGDWGHAPDAKAPSDAVDLSSLLGTDGS